MTDLEITKLCAEAMKLSHRAYAFSAEHPDGYGAGVWLFDRGQNMWSRLYNPLHDDAQAMALVKKFQLSVGFNNGWGCVKNDGSGALQSGAYHYHDLNRAICECVAKMQASK